LATPVTEKHPELAEELAKEQERPADTDPFALAASADLPAKPMETETESEEVAGLQKRAADAAAAAAATAVRWALPAAVDPAVMDVKEEQQAKAPMPSAATSMRKQQDKLFEEYMQKQQEAPKDQHLGWVWKNGNYVWQDKMLAH
jgi:hypothetical protein